MDEYGIHPDDTTGPIERYWRQHGLTKKTKKLAKQGVKLVAEYGPVALDVASTYAAFKYGNPFGATQQLVRTAQRFVPQPKSNWVNYRKQSWGGFKKPYQRRWNTNWKRRNYRSRRKYKKWIPYKKWIKQQLKRGRRFRTGYGYRDKHFN